MASADHRRLRVIKTVAVMDLLLAVTIMSYATFQFSHGSSIIPGNMTRREKLTRLIIYASLHYCFLLIQSGMAVVLYVSTSILMHQPVQNLQRVKTWRAWSSVYMVILMVDAFFVGLALGHGQAQEGEGGSQNRKVVSFGLIMTQLLVRPIGILVVKNMEKLIQHDMGGVFKNQRSVVYDSP